MNQLTKSSINILCQGSSMARVQLEPSWVSLAFSCASHGPCFPRIYLGSFKLDCLLLWVRPGSSGVLGLFIGFLSIPWVIEVLKCLEETLLLCLSHSFLGSTIWGHMPKYMNRVLTAPRLFGCRGLAGSLKYLAHYEVTYWRELASSLTGFLISLDACMLLAFCVMTSCNHGVWGVHLKSLKRCPNTIPIQNVYSFFQVSKWVQNTPFQFSSFQNLSPPTPPLLHHPGWWVPLRDSLLLSNPQINWVADATK